LALARGFENRTWIQLACGLTIRRLQAVDQEGSAGGNALRKIALSGPPDGRTAVDTGLFLLPGTEGTTGVVQQGGGNGVGDIAAAAHKAGLVPVQGAKQGPQARLVKTIDMSPRWVRLAARRAQRASATKILAIRNADDHLVPGDPGNFPTRLGQARLGDMFQDFGTEDRVKLVVGKLQCGNVSLHRLDPGVIDHRLLKIESDDPVEPFREFPGQVAIPRTNVERDTATTRKQ
jgi:hypothetical protein